jgi:hypothetical protein
MAEPSESTNYPIYGNESMPNLAAELHLCSEIPTGEITRGSMEFLLLPPPHDSQKPTLLTTANAFQGN